MVKKKQPDFQKTKLKPGRSLPRGRNVTNTSFKAKKIVLTNKTVKGKSELTIMDCLRNACRNTSPVESRKESLNQLKTLIEQQDTFIVHLKEIISSMRGFIFESDESLNGTAVKVLEAVLLRTDDMKISSHFPYLMTLVTCTMTHTEPKVKGISLRLLHVLLTTHPKLTCHSMTFLKNLQSLLSGPSYNTKSRKKVQNSNLLISSGDTFYSQDWRFQVLAHMNMFLRVLLDTLRGPEIVEDPDDSEKEVHWNSAEGPLYLEIYAGGGLKPVDIEKFDASKFKTADYDLEDPRKVEEFVDGIMDVLSQIFIEEITDGTSKADDDLILSETITNLNILFQVLCNLGEWVTILDNSDFEFHIDMKKSFTKNLVDKIFKNICKFPFIPRGTVFDAKPQQQYKFLPCVQLNLAICYLYVGFILRPESTDSFRFQVLNYVMHSLKMPYEIKYESLPKILKLLKLYLSLQKQCEVLKNRELQDLMFEVIKAVKVDDDRLYQKKLISFFVDLSLEVSPDFLKDNDKLYMKHWYVKLFQILERMPEKENMDKMFLKNVRMIAIRKHPFFIDCLMKVKPSTFRVYLLHGNQDLRETAIYLIYNLPTVPWELLQEITDVILGPYSFPQEKAIMLIQLITPNFVEPTVAAEDRVNFAAFLLNLAIDSVNIDNEKWLDYDLPEFRKAWEPCKATALYTIIPSLQWKEHSKLFEVCYQSLHLLPSSTVNGIAMNLFKEIMSDNRENLPVHTLIAMMKLNNPGMQGRHHKCLIQDLTFSSVFFVSVFTSVDVNDEWYECNVNHLLESLTLNHSVASELIKHLEYEANVEKEGIVVHYILRILRFLFSLHLIHMEERERYLNLLEELKRNCFDNSIERQPLFVKLHDTFCFQYEQSVTNF